MLDLVDDDVWVGERDAVSEAVLDLDVVGVRVADRVAATVRVFEGEVDDERVFDGEPDAERVLDGDFVGLAETTMSTRWAPLSATYTLPVASMAMPPGSQSCEPAMGPMPLLS